jgi:L-lactate dehydrogenase complex protein LldF
LNVTAHLKSPNPPETLGRSPAVRAAAHRALAARDLLLSDYPQWEAWRHQARAIKAEAVARLDELLAELERAVTAWGGRVLWARDAAQARQLILTIAREHEVKTVVKAKSMTTEEIKLNPALAAAGLTVMETDLGEFIVQLAGHPPAHLTAPALHLNRHQIADIFAAHLGIRSPSEPEALTRQATTYLNPYFFEAQMGITGVNFAAAEGTLVLLENESNLRFTATLPKVHVALMGMEKIIPRLTDVELMLRLLPASATGQRLTALVHFIQGLKARPQGDQAFYLVILDNGRRHLAADPEMAEALYCLRCGACLNTCPIFQVGAAHLYGRVYPGAIGILLAPYLAPVGDICEFCTQCGACQENCPVGIRLMEKIHLLRGHSRRFRQLRGLSKATGAVLDHPRWYRGLEPAWRGLASLAFRHGWGRGMPSLAPESFHRQQGRRLGEAGSYFIYGTGSKNLNPPYPPFSKEGNLAECLASPPLKERDVGRFKDQKSEGISGKCSISPAPQGGEAGSGLEKADSDLDSAISGRTHGSAPSRELLAERLKEARSSLTQVQGHAALARRLARAEAPLWLEDHPWLRQVAVVLKEQGVKHQIAETDWTPEGGTAVTVALGAIPETGSVLVDSGGGVAAVLAFRAKQHIILIPPDKAILSLSQALEYVRRRGAGMVSWLTGPSRTADIEKVLVLGAQGPASLEMILYQKEE